MLQTGTIIGEGITYTPLYYSPDTDGWVSFSYELVQSNTSAALAYSGQSGKTTTFFEMEDMTP